MQNANADSLRKRSRYYQSIIDRKILGKNLKYDKLRKTYIIFLCKFDLFGYGLPKYTFENMCLENNEILLGDESTKIFVNSDGNLSDTSLEMKDLLNYVSSGNATGELSREIDAEVELAKMDPEVEEAYMTFQEYLDERYETGLQEGYASGLADGQINAIRKLLGQLTSNEIEDLGFPKSDIDQAQNKAK